MPPEYAEAYRRGYERAYDLRAHEARDHEARADEMRIGEMPAAEVHDEETRAHDLRAGAPEPEATERVEFLDSAFGQAESPYPRARPVQHRHTHDRRRKLVAPALLGRKMLGRQMLAPALLVGLALVLVLTAYGLGRVLSGQVADTDTAPAEPDGVVLGAEGSADGGAEGSADGGAQPKKGRGAKDDAGARQGPKQKAYDGRVAPAAIDGVSASCQSDSGVDAAGNRVGYDPGNVYDGDRSTAWRCAGSGVGQSITLELPENASIGQVGMIPGYAKIDEVSGADRYAQNNRITRVRWLFSDGSAVTQRLNGSPAERDLQTMRVPETNADQVVVEILRSAHGARDTIAISEVGIGEVAG